MVGIYLVAATFFAIVGYEICLFLNTELTERQIIKNIIILALSALVYIAITTNVNTTYVNICDQTPGVVVDISILRFNCPEK